jgi:hypothetical protein
VLVPGNARGKHQPGNGFKVTVADPMKLTYILLAGALFIPVLAPATDYDLGELAKANKIQVFNRTLVQTKADSGQALFVSAAPGDGFAWLEGAELTEGTIEVEVKGKDQQGQSFVGIAFHGQDDRAFDAVYLRPFNFKASEPDRRGHSIQYISMPGHDWSELRNNHPGKYEFAVTPAPEPDSWVKLKLEVKGKKLAAFVNGSEVPALTVELLNDRLKGKVGLWVGNGSDGWFRNLRIISASK